MDRFDIHAHVISLDADRYPHAPLGGIHSGWSTKRPVPAEGLLKQMDDAGVQKAVVVQAATVYGFDNSYAAHALELGGDRFAGVCTVDFLDEDCIKTLDYWIDERSFSGIRMRATDGTTPTPQQGEGMNDPRTFPVWAYLEERGIPACLQMSAKQIPEMLNLLSRFPQLTILMDHCGRPPLEGGPPYPEAKEYFRLGEVDNIYLKVTSFAINQAAKALGGAKVFISTLVEHFGADHLAWGSNFPSSKGTMPELVQLADDVFSDLSEADRQMIFSGTAKSVYSALA